MNNINKIKPIYLLATLTLITIPIVLFIISLLKSSEKTKEGLPPITTPVSSPTPTLLPTLPPDVSELRIIRAAPIQNPQVSYLPVQSIELTFTDPILPEELKYDVKPYVETTVRQGSISNVLIIRPKLKWEEGETTIAILITTTAKGGAKLLSQYVYRMISAIPPAPEGEGNY